MRIHPDSYTYSMNFVYNVFLRLPARQSAQLRRCPGPGLPPQARALLTAQLRLIRFVNRNAWGWRPQCYRCHHYNLTQSPSHHDSSCQCDPMASSSS